jgi:hypothetical protein
VVKDLLDPRTWRSGPVMYCGAERLVWWVPDTPRNKIGMDQLDGSWYYHNTTDDVVCNTARLSTLIRMTQHMLRGHRGETVLLSDVSKLCRDSHVQILSLDMDKAQGPEGDEVLEKLRSALTKTGRVRDTDKVSAKDRINKVVFFKYKFYDKRLKREVVKIGAVLATLIGALNDFRRRVKNIRSMDAWICFYSLLAQRIFVTLEEGIVHSLEGLMLMSKDISDKKPYQAIKDQISMHLNRVEALSRFRPFKRAAGYLVLEAKEMQGFLDSKDFMSLCVTLRKSKLSLCLLSLRCVLERSKTHIRDWETSEGALRQRIVSRLFFHQAILGPLSDDNFKTTVLERIKLDLYALLWYLHDGDLERALESLDYILNLI